MPTENELKKMWKAYVMMVLKSEMEGTIVAGAKGPNTFEEFREAIKNAKWVCDCEDGSPCCQKPK
jgi:hypothetical protein